MATKHAERTITYASPEDWDSWSNEFKKLAHAYDLWQTSRNPGLPQTSGSGRSRERHDDAWFRLRTASTNWRTLA
ncbi:hypothetical protein FOCG_17880 [Fusarium oxysporum f. sp. radicis-lycopersici 26381]|uniref:Uncharacterized protein n=1 Tax=Fusarium oxysporum f. sp. melonis 26406 TaxID=1089452 RepID=W9YVI8_FUSOX|nr:hypothetical protein FOWG_17682 [Fusarium oxysporum f. sp. lycopersici MN25]EXK23190.1 hypothetical protein FOMG_20029 [Fusarium oxysporum f. sp. melonis 26406]EXL39503.1 hypothetical protein FOCG_17880 [Fusarium oxysporum f. sp. radicis-lycopersici 26381]